MKRKILKTAAIPALALGLASVGITSLGNSFSCNEAIPVYADPATSGTCGENLTWSYAYNRLEINGTGAMYNYDNDTNKAPWNSFAVSIQRVYLSTGVTMAGDYAFYGYNDNYFSVVSDANLVSIGKNLNSIRSRKNKARWQPELSLIKAKKRKKIR